MTNKKLIHLITNAVTSIYEIECQANEAWKHLLPHDIGIVISAKNKTTLKVSVGLYQGGLGHGSRTLEWELNLIDGDQLKYLAEACLMAADDIVHDYEERQQEAC